MSNIAYRNENINKNTNDFLLECHNHMASNNIIITVKLSLMRSTVDFQ